MKRLISNFSCLKVRGLVKECYQCRKYPRLCKGDSNKIVEHYTGLIKRQREVKV